MKHLHERRGVTFQELGALLGTRALLASKLVTYGPRDDPPEHAHTFNMATACQTQDCGTVGCIGGTMALIMGTSPQHYVGRQDGADNPWRTDGSKWRSQTLHDLFYPPEGDRLTPWDQITVKQAIRAIDNWLDTGKPGWKSILAIKRKKR